MTALEPDGIIQDEDPNAGVAASVIVPVIEEQPDPNMTPEEWEAEKKRR